MDQGCTTPFDPAKAGRPAGPVVRSYKAGLSGASPERRPAVRSLGGIDALGGGMESFRGGLVVVQDEANDGAPNLKYIDWTAVKDALGL